VIKVIAPAQKNPERRTLAEFHNYWGESHGPLFANTRRLRRYVQHLTLPEAYGGDPAPTYDGVSMFWYDDLDALRSPSDAPEDVALREAVRDDDRQLFDRTTTWPMHAKRASVVANERVVVDGETAPSMVKGLFIASKLPGLTLDEFSSHWYEVHGPLAAKVPGLRRYVQNHAIPEAYGVRAMTHDGWAEMWFDDLESLQRAVKSPEWQALREDGKTLFAQPMGVGIARERVQKWEGRPLTDWGIAPLSEPQIREKLRAQGYTSLARDTSAPAKLKRAAQAGMLAVWTAEHIVTIDASCIDARADA
jgi:uncharacterized protein (TIGR02118 family)